MCRKAASSPNRRSCFSCAAGSSHIDMWDLKPKAPARVSRPVRADRHLRPRHRTERTSAAARRAGASSEHRPLGRRHRQHQRPPRRVLPQSDRPCPGHVVRHAGQQPHAGSRRLAVYGFGRRRKETCPPATPQRDHPAPQTEQSPLHAAGTIRRPYWGPNTIRSTSTAASKNRCEFHAPSLVLEGRRLAGATHRPPRIAEHRRCRPPRF